MPFTETEQKSVEVSELKTLFGENHRLLLWNDEVNTFEHVIFCLTHHLSYSETNAERLALKVHTEGKAPVLQGTFTEMEVYRKILKSEGLTVSIE